MKKLIVGNFKENVTKIDLDKYIKELEKVKKDEEVVIAPSYPYLGLINSDKIGICAQDVSCYEKGSYTGEVSILMLKELNVDYVMVGHNERRTIFYETNNEVNNKIKLALKHRIKVILCVSSIFELKQSLKGIDDYEDIIIAFEPRKYIGTNITLDPSDLVKFITKINKITKNESRIIYGGGITNENINKLSKINGLDGILVGKSSLDIDKFKEIILKY